MSKVSTRQQKIEWLLKNQKLWEGFMNSRTGRDNSGVWEKLVSGMKEAGLVSPQTHTFDIGLVGLIDAARTERRFRKAGVRK